MEIGVPCEQYPWDCRNSIASLSFDTPGAFFVVFAVDGVAAGVAPRVCAAGPEGGTERRVLEVAI